MYRAPQKDIRFVLDELLNVQSLAGSPGLADYSPELAESILSEAARFAETVLEPLNIPGDREGARWTPDGVITPKGFKEAYQQFVAGGWPQLGADPEYGGQAVPHALGTAVREMWGSANLAFKLCPMLTLGAVEAMKLCASPEQKARYLPKMVSGEWTGTMVLTEPHAGSDLGLIRTRAVPAGDHYRMFGQKIFITWGEHDCADNIIHMVIARIDGAPPGTRGISLFIVPKVLVKADGSLGERNEVRCVSIEHKLGIHASPTCTLAFGDDKGAVAYLIGEPNRGLEYMFIMMNAARLSVGAEGYAVAERAFQRAADWARTRVQGKPPTGGASGPATIIHHPDVKRMLLTMKSATEAMRALALYAGFQLDSAEHHADEAQRKAAHARAELLIPVVKGWCTELGNEIAAVGVQVHGGMGFIEETGAAQYVRDVRITTIYEGTTGIQANDLLGRKMGRDRGATMSALLQEMTAELATLKPTDDSARNVVRAATEAVALLRDSTQSLLTALASSPDRALAVAVPFLMLTGFVMGGWLMAKSAVIAASKLSGSDGEFHAAKLRTTLFYSDQILPRSAALARIVKDGGASVTGTDAGLI
jgi:alkylation response protein AidB-like acyl-CoA dehydrogenase